MRADQETGIRQLLATSSDCVWRKDIEGYGACWSEQGQWRILGRVAVGREQIKQAWWAHMNVLQTAWQVQHAPVLESVGEEILGRVYLDETLLLPDGSIHLSRGIYHDTYRVEEGRWVYLRRHFDLVYLGPTDMSGRFFGTAAYGPAPQNPDPERPATPDFDEVYG